MGTLPRAKSHIAGTICDFAHHQAWRLHEIARALSGGDAPTEEAFNAAYDRFPYRVVDRDWWNSADRSRIPRSEVVTLESNEP